MKYIKYRETKEHGTFEFPMEFYHVGPAHPRYEMSYHWHIEYEIIRILKGEFLMTIGEEEFTAKAGISSLSREGCSTGAYRRIACMSVLCLILILS